MCTKSWLPSPAGHKPGIMAKHSGGVSRRITRSRSSLATQGVHGQPGLHETLSKRESNQARERKKDKRERGDKD